MRMRLPLSKDNFATIINVYAPTMTNPDENKEAFYNQLANVLSGIPHTDKLPLVGNFNARIARDNGLTWSSAITGLGNATAIAIFYWFCALSLNR